MNRRTVLHSLIALSGLPLVAACTRAPSPASVSGTATVAALGLAPQFWRDKVSPAAFNVLFGHATEPSGSSPLDHEKRSGAFVCAACYAPLFLSAQKFDSGTGWPSFTHAIAGTTATQSDYRMLLPRTEYHCARCGGHQGHIFNDGPQPLGTRWCNNGLALSFVAQTDVLPALRG